MLVLADNANNIADGFRQTPRHTLNQAGVTASYNGDLIYQRKCIQNHDSLVFIFLTLPLMRVEGERQKYKFNETLFQKMQEA